MGERAALRSDRRTRARRRRVGVAGVVLVVAGLGVIGTVVWQQFGVSAMAADGQQRAAAAQVADWRASAPGATSSAGATAATVPVDREPRATGTVAVLRVPRFGTGWSRVVRQGVDEATVLNSFTAGVGHYPGTAMPGGVGNFAVAGHDTGWGNSFIGVGSLRIGDRILVDTRAGTYTYAFRNFQWVPPSGVGVLLPVPDSPGHDALDRLITLTTCDPPYNAQERLIAYGVFVGFRAAGA